jgi:hypothetical protein
VLQLSSEHGNDNLISLIIQIELLISLELLPCSTQKSSNYSQDSKLLSSTKEESKEAAEEGKVKEKSF